MHTYLPARRLSFVCGLLLCLLTGALRAADLLLWTDPATGFARVGGLWLRAAVLAAAALLLALLSRRASRRPLAPLQTCLTLPATLTLTAVALGANAGRVLLGGDLPIHFAALRDLGPAYLWLMLTNSGLLTALLALLAGIWCVWAALRCLRGGPPAPAAGGLAVLPWFAWVAIERFLAAPAAVSRLPATTRVLCAGAALVFIAALLRLLYVPAQPKGQTLFFAGMLCFLGGACLELPQVLLTADGQLLEALAMAGLGLTGLAGAWYATGPEGESQSSGPAQKPSR